MSKSKIEWTEQTANPIIGCWQCSPACKNCYALTMARRLAGMKGPVGDDYRRVVTDGDWNGATVFIPGVLDKIIKRKKPTTYFIGSMTDIFYDSVPYDWIDQILCAIRKSPQHWFMILTKRYLSMCAYMMYRQCPPNPPKNLALGVSVWDQDSFDRNVGALLRTPAARLFVSAEPLLGPINTSGIDLSKIDLVIVGGETGHCARPMHPDWARSLRDQCAVAGVPFMFKGWGNCMPCHYDKAFRRVRKEKAGRLIDGVEHSGSIQWEAAR